MPMAMAMTINVNNQIDDVDDMSFEILTALTQLAIQSVTTRITAPGFTQSMLFKTVIV